VIKTICQQMQKNGVYNAIIIVQLGMTPSAKQARGFFPFIFSLKNFLFIFSNFY
jgi:hypothetical protein